MQTIIIGGGPAGILVAISSAQKGDDVTIIENMESLRKKITHNWKGEM